MRIFASIMLALVGCQQNVIGSTPDVKVLTYQELVDYPGDCSLKEKQLAELKNLQKIKNFNPNPDLLKEEDHDYNSRLKATIWWYAYRREES